MAIQIPHAAVDPLAIAEALSEYWSPKVIAEFDDCYIKVAKVLGQFVWHAHEHEDEVLHVLRGSLRIAMESHTVQIDAGQVYVVPRGVRHCPIAEQECLILLIERKSTLHTGGVDSPLTKDVSQQLI